MNEEKADALLKWVNSAEVAETVNNLQQLSNGSLLLRIICLIDKEQTDEIKNNGESSDLSKVVYHLEDFYQQSLSNVIDQNEISCENVLEIGKVVSLVLSYAVQGENASLFVDLITKLDEDIQRHIKDVIEAILKEVDCERINAENIENILCQSVCAREGQGLASEEFHSSPVTIVTSPVSLFNSPIKALMASPHMQSRQSQATISKLYKKLNQLQITINNHQRTLTSLEHEVEEKNKQIERQDQKMSSLLKKVAELPGLEDEIQSLCSCEKELEDAKRECESLKKKIEQLNGYKEQVVKLEKECSDSVSEKAAEKVLFESRLIEMRDKSDERISQIQSSLEEKNINNNRMKIKLMEASSVETTMKDELNKYKIELRKLNAALEESKRKNEELCQWNEKEVLRQLTREKELKLCFKETETSLQLTVDQLQLQDSNLHQDIQQLRHDLEEKENLRRTLECDLADVVCERVRLQTELKSQEYESDAAINKLIAEKNKINEALQESQAEKKLAQDSLCRKDVLLNDLQNLNQALEEEKNQALEENAAIADVLVESNLSLKGKDEQLELLSKKCEELQNTMEASNEEKMLVAEHNLSLKEKVEQLEHLTTECEELQSALKAASEEKTSLVEDNLSLKEKVEQLELLSKEYEEIQSALKASKEEKTSLVENNNKQVQKLEYLTRELEELQNDLKASTEEKVSVMEDNFSLKNKVEQLEPLAGKCEKLQNALKDSTEEKVSLVENNLALKEKVKRFELLSEECESLQSALKVLTEKKVSLIEDNVLLKEKLEQLGLLSKKCESIQIALKVSSKEKVSLVEDNLALKDKVEQLEVLTKEYEELQSALKVATEEKASLMEDNLSLKNKVKQLEVLTKECEKLQSALKASNEEKSSLGENTNNKVQQLEHLVIELEELQNALNASNEEKAPLMEDNLLLKERVEQLQKATIEERTSLVEHNLSLKARVRQLEHLARECEELQNALKASNEENIESNNKVQQLDHLVIELEKLQRGLKASNEEKALLVEDNLLHKHRVGQLELLTKEYEKLKSALNASSEEKISLVEHNLSLKERVEQLEHLTMDSEKLQSVLQAAIEEKTSLVEHNLLLKVRVEQLDPLSNECQKLESALKVASEEKALLIENNLLLEEKLTSANALRDELKEAKNSYSFQRENMTNSQDDLKYSCDQNINKDTKCEMVLCEKERSVLASNIETKVEEMKKIAYVKNEDQSTINEADIESLRKEILGMQKANDKLKEIQERKEENWFKERERAKCLQEQLESSENEIKKLNGNSLHLREEMMKLKKQMEVFQKENFKLKEDVPKLEENVINLEQKLVEEELISKRLGVEVRSLEGQLVYADCQLRQKLTNEETYKDEEIYKKQTNGISNELSLSTASIVSTNSVVSESSLVECSEGRKTSGDQRNDDEEKENVGKPIRDQSELGRKLRRRSALYQTKDVHRMEVSEKRRSTVGGTFLVVDQFTTDDEPTLFGCDYDWNRIIELQQRNAACLPHMRSSYPVETQVCTKQEVEEEELKTGRSTSCVSRKRLRDHASDSTLSVTFQIPVDTKAPDARAFPRSKSDDRIGKRFSERLASKLNSVKTKSMDENRNLLSSTLSLGPTTNSDNIEQFSRRESIAFNVELSPPKKVRPTLQRGIHRSFGKSNLALGAKKENVNVRSKTKEKLHGLKKFPLPRKTSAVKSDKKPLTAGKNTNIA